MVETKKAVFLTLAKCDETEKAVIFTVAKSQEKTSLITATNFRKQFPNSFQIVVFHMNMSPLIKDISSCDGMLKRKRVIVPLHEEKVNTPRRVSFCSMVIVYKVKSRKNYRPKEIRACWYDSKEECEIQRNVLSDINLAEAGRLDPSIPFRGLESHTRLGFEQKAHNRIGAYTAVLSEMEYQKEEKIIDEDCLAAVYSAHTTSCVSRARLLAKMDEIEAFRIYDEDASACS